MLRMKIKENNHSKVSYEFYPEKCNTAGVVELNKDTLDITLIKKPSENIESMYLGHAIYALKKMAEVNDYPNEKTVAWY